MTLAFNYQRFLRWTCFVGSLALFFTFPILIALDVVAELLDRSPFGGPESGFDGMELMFLRAIPLTFLGLVALVATCATLRRFPIRKADRGALVAELVGVLMQVPLIVLVSRVWLLDAGRLCLGLKLMNGYTTLSYLESFTVIAFSLSFIIGLATSLVTIARTAKATT